MAIKIPEVYKKKRRREKHLMGLLTPKQNKTLFSWLQFNPKIYQLVEIHDPVNYHKGCIENYPNSLLLLVRRDKGDEDRGECNCLPT